MMFDAPAFLAQLKVKKSTLLSYLDFNF